MAPTFNQAAQRIAEAGLRMTRPREVLLRLVLETRSPFSVKMLYERAEKQGFDIHLATVHRNLADFVTVGLLDELPGDDNRLYVLHAENESGTHVYCVDCHLVRALEGTELESYQALSRALNAQGFDASTMRMMVTVHCKSPHHTDSESCEK